MAGRNNAVNLTGMLSEMNQAISGFGEAGNQYVDTLRRSMAPKADMSDSKSLESYANWARRNGYGEEADKYMALAYKQKEVEKQEAKDAALGKTMAGATQSSTLGQKLGAKGDLGGADATIDSLRKRLDNPDIQKNPLAVEAIQEEIRGLQASRPDFVAANNKARVRGVAQMDQQIAGLSKDDPDYSAKKANLEAARAHLLSDAETEKAYEDQKLDLMEIESKKMDMMWKQQSPAILAEMNANADDPDKLQGVMDKYPQFATQMLAVQGTILDLAQQRNEIRGANFRVEQLGPKIDREIKELEESDLPGPIKKQAIDLLSRSKSYLSAGEVHPPNALANYDKLRGQVDQLLINEAASQAGVIRQREQRAQINHEKAMLTQVTEADVVALARAKYGDTPTEEQLTEAEGDLLSELDDYRMRTAISAGEEEPLELTAGEKADVRADLKNKVYGEDHDVAVMKATYQLVSEGFSKESVVEFLDKELLKGEADRAEQIYDDMWADLQAQDANTAKPSEAASYRDGLRGVRNNESPLLTWFSRASETLQSRYDGFIERRSQTMYPRLEEVSGPSITKRQKANLSLPLGRLGSQDSKLRDAREGQRPTGEYPYPGEGVRAQPLSQDYVDPRYRGFGG